MNNKQAVLLVSRRAREARREYIMLKRRFHVPEDRSVINYNADRLAAIVDRGNLPARYFSP